MRKADDWITSYLTYTSRHEVPENYRMWAGMTAISAALQRKVWLEWEAPKYANLWSLLIGHTGVGKTTAMSPVRDLLYAAGIQVAPNRITNERFVQYISEHPCSFKIGEDTIIHESVTVFNSEISVFLGYKNDVFLQDLADLYDCPPHWNKETKNSGKDELTNAWLTMMGGITPELMKSHLPATSAGGGFLGRFILVFADHRGQYIDDPRFIEKDLVLGGKLIDDLKDISLIKGEYELTPSYLKPFKKWALETYKNPPFQGHYLFNGYNTRRRTHLQKLSMLFAASESNSLQLTERHFNRALDAIKKVEANMPQALSVLGVRPETVIIDRVKHFIAHRKKCTSAEVYNAFCYDLSQKALFDILAELAAIEAIKFEGAGTIVSLIQ